MDLASAADELYGLPLSDFVPARTRLEKLARAADDRQLAADVHALRKPSQAAWAVNQLVRRSPELIEDLLRLGEELRTAQVAGDTAGLRGLTARRHELFATLRRRAEELVAEDGRQHGGTADRALEGTLGAAMSDPRAAEVVRSGRLVVDLETAGWGPVDLDGAQAGELEVALASAAAAPTRDVAARRREAERDLVRAEEAAAHAAAALDRAEDALAAASAEQRRLVDRKATLLQELRQIKAEEDRAAQSIRAAREAKADAGREVARTARQATRAQRHVEDLTSRA